MDWPDRSVESIPREEFWPPFCPNADCVAHRKPERSAFVKGSIYPKKDGTLIRRYVCKLCHRTCIKSTFAATYWMRRPELLVPIAAGLVAGSAHRQIARSLGCAPSTVTRLAARLGRHSMLLQAMLLARLGRIPEPVVHDDFEGFVCAQVDAFGLGTTVGTRSWFWYGLDFAPHQRAVGRARKRRVAAPEHRDPGSYRRALARILDLLTSMLGPGEELDLATDNHPDYRAAIAAHPMRHRIVHRVCPNPPRDQPRTSPVARWRDQLMFPVDLLHKLIRHSQAHHRRETIAFGRRLNAVLERAFLLAVWRNVVKARTERRPDRTTPAMWLGLTDQPWSWSRVLAQRLFRSKIPLPAPWPTLYRRAVVTTCIGRNCSHDLKYAG